MRLRSLTAVVTAAAVALPVAAYAARPKKAEPSAAQVAEAKSRADALIAGTGAPELFLNVTDGDTPRVLHLPSRVICYFDGDAAGDSLSVGTGRQRDDIVDCVSGGGEVTRRLSASRAGGTGAAEQRARTTVAALRSAQPDAGPVDKAGASSTWKLQIPLSAYSFQSVRGGEVLTTNVSAIDAREWALTHETTSAGRNAKISSMVAQSLSEIYLTLTLYEMAGVTKNGEPVEAVRR